MQTDKVRNAKFAASHKMIVALKALRKKIHNSKILLLKMKTIGKKAIIKKTLLILIKKEILLKLLSAMHLEQKSLEKKTKCKFNLTTK